jgi:arylsulfatase A-like enzyme
VKKWIPVFLCIVFVYAAMASERKPNVIIFYVDDMGWAGIGSYGCDFIDTPEIDQLTSTGVRFTNAYSPAPNCSPSRASMLTGLYPPRHRITQYLPGNKDTKKFGKTAVVQADLPPGLDPAFTTIAEVFKAGGYATASMGKWHLGGDAFSPQKHGFDRVVGGNEEGHHKTVFPPYLIDPDALQGKPDEHITHCLLRHALAFIEHHADKPFFLYMPFYSVHKPFGGNKELQEKYEKRFPDDKTKADYAAMTEGVDRFVGAVVSKLQELGIDQDTLIVFSSDNGGVFKETCEALRERKGFVYEGGIRVPCVVAGRGVKGGRVDDTPVNHIDLMPTLAAMAGLEAPAGDGVDLRPILEGTGEIPERDLFWHYPHYANSGGKPGSVIRRGEYKLIHFYENDAWELYNLKEDPAETRNLAGEQPERAAALRRKLEDWLRETGAVIPVRRP